jgi:hypothetical protein
MSVAAGSSKKIYAGDGSTTVFPITFPLPVGSTGSDIKAVVVDNLGNLTELGSNYSVDLNAMTVTYPVVGGISPLAPAVNALPAGWQIVLARVEPLAQLLSLVAQGSFSAAAIEKAFDLLTMIAQQLQEQMNRAVLLPINTPDSNESPVVAPTAGVLIRYEDTFAHLQAIAAAAPTVQFWGYATDRFILYFYSGNTSLGDGGFIAAAS